ncbi:DUF3299 domain-containing protein [Noviherbaspirillum saxi]|uniref:DUF3299 domain-containing protein n=1 Tax=Noviherbaspirillum saxi TaxID=2320863 RepID=A0A3A3FQV1_9BURK|nr:DUF3299 domain-containing protein [Noviherbaspirillum saxi]RJF97584.1 DUF3299 domain-containing protein [Noviherbaspirillum saxi]
MHFTFRIVLSMTLAVPLLALSATPSPQPQNAPAGHVPSGVPPAAMQQLPEINGVVSWNTLAKVTPIKTKDRILPEFSKEIVALNDKEVKVQGFMMPLEPGEKQKHFLISMNPQSCSFCLPAGPEGVVEVKTKTPVKYTFEPVILSGRMAVLKDDPMGLYYRLTDAMPVTMTAK